MQQVDISSKSALPAPRIVNTEFVGQVMSSLEIAELVGSRHSDVMRTIDRLIEKSVISGCAPSAYTHEQNGQPYAQYLVTKRDSYVIVAQLCPEFTAVLVDRWQELEARVAQPQQITHLDTARMLVASLEVQAEQAALLAIAAPKAAFVDQYVEASGSMSFRQVCKLICANERAFRQMLLDKNVMYYLGGVLTPYKPHQDAGRIELKTGSSEHNGHAFSQARFTAKGVQWVAGLWAARQIEAAA
jgi:phage antirepressor YoqD-like protein